MSKQWKPNKKTVELEQAARPSRIRREPARADAPATTLLGKVQWTSPEWETRLAIAGIIFFALGLSALVVDIGEVLSR